MSQLDPFALPGRFWRGNLHTHSTASDGHLAPVAVCHLYRAAGYDFLAITDHFLEAYGYRLTDVSAHDSADFVTLRAAELHAGRMESGHFWHLLGIGLPTEFARPSEDETGPQLAARALAAGSFVVAAHPAWYGAIENEIRSLGPIHAIEAWNATRMVAGHGPTRSSSRSGAGHPVLDRSRRNLGHEDRSDRNCKNRGLPCRDAAGECGRRRR